MAHVCVTRYKQSHNVVPGIYDHAISSGAAVTTWLTTADVGKGLCFSLIFSQEDRLFDVITCSYRGSQTSCIFNLAFFLAFDGKVVVRVPDAYRCSIAARGSPGGHRKEIN